LKNSALLIHLLREVLLPSLTNLTIIIDSFIYL